MNFLFLFKVAIKDCVQLKLLSERRDFKAARALVRQLVNSKSPRTNEPFIYYLYCLPENVQRIHQREERRYN